MGVANVPAASAAGLQPYYQKFTSSGTFTLPTGYGVSKPLLIDIQVIGGGGGGRVTLANAIGASGNVTFRASQDDYFGNGTQFNSNAISGITIGAGDLTNNTNGHGGGSGGIAKTQMYLTSNLTVTVGAAGSRGIGTLTPSGDYNVFWKRDMQNTNGITDTRSSLTNINTSVTAGTGGTSTAGAVSAIGGSGATGNIGNYLTATITNWSRTNAYTPNLSGAITSTYFISGGGSGAAGQPAGSAGGATPLLGALAGGSGDATPVYGAFGVGGKKGDGATHSGVEGTGGGHGSIGASGAVIITYWA